MPSGKSDSCLATINAVCLAVIGLLEVSMFIIASNVPWLENYATLAEKLYIGVTMMLLGVTIVFAVLVVISLFVSLLSLLINTGGNSSYGRKAGKAGESAAKPAAVTVPAAAAASSADAPADDQAIIAVITAAVAACLAETTPRSSAGFTIRRVRRV